MAHEDLKREQHVDGSSDRAFGLVFAGVFLLLALIPLIHGTSIRWWSVSVAVVFGLVAMLRSSLLAVLNQLWIKLGILLGKVVSPIALGILFYAVVTPIGLLVRLTGKDSLRLKFDPAAKSYWIQRTPPGPPPKSMTNPF